jgi:hypothetical protein
MEKSILTKPQPKLPTNQLHTQIIFSMFMPNLLRNFLYNPPGTGSMVADFAMSSAARELHVSASLSRRFFWTGAA